jgi:hypothetical protein
MPDAPCYRSVIGSKVMRVSMKDTIGPGGHVASNQQVCMRLGCNPPTYRESPPLSLLSVSRILRGIKEISFTA